MPGRSPVPRFRMDVRSSRSGPSSIGAALLWTAAAAAGLTLYALTHVSGPRAAATAGPGPEIARSLARPGEPVPAPASVSLAAVPRTEASVAALAPELDGLVLDPAAGPQAGIELAVGGQVVTTDASGRFRLASLVDWPRVDLRSQGYTLMGSDGGDPTGAGGWTTLVVLVAPRAAASVRVIDSCGTPLEGLVVSAALDDSESALRRRASTTIEEARLAISDRDGVATFDDLWAGRNLSISLLVDGQRIASDARLGDRLCLDETRTRKRAIVLAPGPNAGLEVVLESGPRVVGRVVDERGRPVAGVRVEVVDRGRPASVGEPLRVLTSDAEGRFGGVVRATRLFGPLSVEVDPCRDPVRGALARLGYRGREDVAGVPQGARVDAALDDPRLADLELRLVPHLPIEGVLRGLSQTAGVRIWAVASGQPVWTARHEGRVDASGGFELRVPDGFLDLLVEDPARGAEDVVRFAGIRAGARGIELELPASQPVSVHVQIAGLERPMGTILLRRYLPTEPDDGAVPAADPEMLVTATSAAAPGDLPGEVVDTVLGFGALSGSLELTSGCFALGVHAASADGTRRFAPLVGGPRRFERGEYTVTFEPLPAGVLRGHVTGVQPGDRWAVALVDAKGRPVPLAPPLSFHPLAATQGVSASGDFLLPAVPAGSLRLRLGSPEQLAHGAFQLERFLEVAPGENPAVELVLR